MTFARGERCILVELVRGAEEIPAGDVRTLRPPRQAGRLTSSIVPTSFYLFYCLFAICMSLRTTCSFFLVRCVCRSRGECASRRSDRVEFPVQ